MEATSSDSASTAQATNAQRQSISTAIGTAMPHSSVAPGFAASLIPNATPCRRAGTLSATVALAASCAIPLTMPVASRSTTNIANEPARAAIVPATTAVVSAAARRLGIAPSRSTTRPSRAENSDWEMKHADKARPTAAGPIPNSARICGASAPARYAGSTPTVETAVARAVPVTTGESQAGIRRRATKPLIARLPPSRNPYITSS